MRRENENENRPVEESGESFLNGNAGNEDIIIPEDEIVTPSRVSKKKKKKAKDSSEKKKKRLFTPLFTVILIAVMLLVGWASYVGAYVFPLVFGTTAQDNGDAAPITEEQKVAFDSGKFVVLMMGSDRREGWEVSRSDTLMVGFVDLDKKQVRLLSIPRDTYITIPTSGEETKINHAYAYGGVDLTKQTLAYNFGIECDYYMDIDFQGFIDVIDVIGGITVNVPMDMYYPDEGIDLKAGVQTLDGNGALQFCRFRSDGQGDLGRVDRQQAFLVALKKEMFSAGTVLKIPDLCTAVQDNVLTDFTGLQLLQVMLAMKDGFDLQTYQPDNVPDYKNDISYVFVTKKGTALIDALVSFSDIPEGIDATTDKVDISPAAEEAAPAGETEE